MCARRRGEYVRLQLGPHDIGVLLLDPASGRLYLRLREHWEDLDGDIELLELLEEDLRRRAAEMGGEDLLRWMEDTLSNALLITGREEVEVASFTHALDRLFARYVGESPVKQFRTHLPLFSLPVAAGAFGEEYVAEREPEDWVRIPGRHLYPDMFVAPVVGRSMEPLIPVGSLNVFRYGVVGSRTGRIVLVELLDTLDEGARYTVKRYRSGKVRDENHEWEHGTITLEPLNPDFQPIKLAPDRLKVIAEWICVLE